MKYDVYDFDGTIYNGDSGIDFVLFSIKKKPSRLFKIMMASLSYLFRLCTKEEFKSRIFSFIKDIKDMDVYLQEFWKKYEHKMKNFWVNKKSHKKDIIISASCRFWLEPIAKKYKVAQLIATECDLQTGEIIGINCHGEEKVKLFYQNFPKGEIEKMYTDSFHDLPLIEEAKESYLVKKDKIILYKDYKPNFFIRFWRFGWSIYHKNEEVWNYLIVGGLTTLVSIAVKWGLYFTILDVNKKLDAQIGVCVSWICAVSFAYIANRIYVFKSKSKSYLKELVSFVSARLLTLGMEMCLTFLFFTILGLTSKLWIVTTTFIIQIVIMVLNYIFSKLFVFRKKK